MVEQVDVNHIIMPPEMSKVVVPEIEDLQTVEDLWNSRLTWKFAAIKCNMTIDRISKWRDTISTTQEK